MNRVWTAAAGPRGKWVVLALWILVAVALGPLQPRLQGSTENDPATFLPDGADSRTVLELVEERFASGRTVPALAVWQREGGLTDADRGAVGRQVAGLAGLGPVVSPLEPGAEEQGLLSPDGSTAVAVVPIASSTIEEIEPAVEEIRAVVEGGGGLETWVTGPAAVSVDAVEIFGSIDATLLLATTALILVLLLLIYRSPVVALVPLAVVALAYTVAAGLVYLLVSQGWLEVNGQTTGILIILMFGAGTDYCLLIVARYREELRRYEDKHEAMAKALVHTSPAILSSGATVVCAMLVLLVTSLNSSTGPVFAAGVAVTMLAGLTLLPALLTIAGRRAFWPAVPRLGEEAKQGGGIWRRTGNAVARRPAATALATVALLLVCAAGNAVDLPGLSLSGGFRNQTESVEGAEALARALPAGETAPTEVIVGAEPGRVSAAATAAAGRLEAEAGVASVGSIELSEDGRLARFQLILEDDPYSDAAVERVESLRETAAATGERVLLGGPTAEEADTRATARSDAALAVPLTLAVIFLILVALLRAVVAPVYLILSVILSFAATMGLAYAAFAYVFDSPGSDASLPLLVFVFVVALGVDYNIFLMARVREEVARHGSREGVLVGLEKTGGVITSAGLILAGTFAVLMLLPLEQLFQLGFAVAVGILLDTFVVRTLLVPSVALLLGDRSWWPGRQSVAIFDTR
ncbi:MAG TPA: MMPL family transporter [Gaiellaceae bacterium]|nr:MMPL family transporter [Gaiellaceae bacterium]